MILFFTISAVINVITSISLAIFVYFQNPEKKLNRYFSLFAISVAFWSMGYFAWQTARDAETALIWLRVLMLGAIFIPIFYFHFVVTLLKLSQKMRALLVGGYVFALIFIPLTFFTDSVISGVTSRLWFPFWPQPGILFHIFLLGFFAYTAYSWYLLIRAIQSTTDHNRKTQILYVFWGTLIGFLGGSTNYFLWYDISIPPIGNFAVAIYVAMIGLAILKTQLFDIRILLTQLLVGVLSVLLFINLILSETTFEYFWKGSMLLAFLGAGYLLVKSVMNEIKIREDLERAYVKVKELDEAKSEFVSIASHQLRTPLTAIKGYISMLIEGTYGKLLPRQKKPMENMYRSNERLITLVNDLLNISRIESGRVKMEWQKAKLQEVIQEVIDELQIKAKQKRLKLVLQQPKLPLPSFNMDPVKVRNIVLNIIDNAIRYTRKGSIILTLSSQPANRTFATKNALITIKDTGEGMSKEELRHLFESFSRGKTGTKMWTEGTGLGLYIAKQYVQMHKGRIWAKSPGKGKGSTFFVELPVQ